MPGNQPRGERDGIILLVVLGMLTLFSMLAVSYLVFTRRHRSAASSIANKESLAIDSEALIEDAITNLLVGSNGPDSMLWGHAVIADLYGMRDGLEGQLTLPGRFVDGDNAVAPRSLLEGNFIRFPTELFRDDAGFGAVYSNGRNDTSAERQYPGQGSTTPVAFPMDDMLTGRYLTFEEGPLEDLTFQIVRYFGDHLDVPTASDGNPSPRRRLSGQVVIDVRPHLHRQIRLNGVSETLAERLADPTFDVSLLFYSLPVTNPNALPLSAFWINGRVQDGPGIGWDVTRSTYDMTTGSEFNLNDMVSTSADIVGFTGTPRQGTDFGAGGSDIPVSMQPNYVMHRIARESPTNALRAYLQDLPPGDVDEPVDAPTIDDMWLSYFPQDAELGRPSPSFVRPALVNWIINQKGDLDAITDPNELISILRALQRSTLRPIRTPGGGGAGALQLNYAGFTGSNLSPGLNTRIDPTTMSIAQFRTALIQLAQDLAGADRDGDEVIDSWDVDTDGDGRVDSVWIDAGLALVRSPDNRLVKPLVAFKVEDLGGRANINLIGNVAQVVNNHIRDDVRGPIQQPGPSPYPSDNPPADYTENQFPVGFGYGPAEISLLPLFVNQYVASNGPLEVIRSRYNQFELSTNPGYFFYAPGHGIDPATSSPNDLLGLLRNPPRANLFHASNIYSVPFDPFGRVSVGLGVGGGLMANRASFAVQNTGAVGGNPTGGQTFDDPYEFVADASREPDAPFTYADLEPVLRFSDFDRDLFGSRLLDLINEYHNDPAAVPDQLEAVRKLLADCLTTSSNVSAVPVGPMPSEWRDNAVFSQNALPQLTLFWQNLRLPTGDTPGKRNALLWQLLAPEIHLGRRFNINRPFGNGIDDDSDGVVDDPTEVATVPAAGSRFYQGTAWETNRGDVTPGEPGLDSRALYARHLYFLVLCMIRDANADEDFEFPHNYADSGTFDGPFFEPPVVPAGGGDAEFALEYRSWKVAQWVANVVDFRDSDAIMTRFRYDPNPFDGWDVNDADPNTYRTVWGMERPEATLEESFALHDRRVRDTADDDHLDGGGNPDPGERVEGNMFKDDDPDQWRIPQGSVFLEIRSTRSPQELIADPVNLGDDTRANRWAVPTELYARYTPPGATQEEFALDLAREAPGGNPIWRIAISTFHNSTSFSNLDRCPDFLYRPVGSNTPAELALLGAVDENRDTALPDPANPDFFSTNNLGATPNTDRAVDRVIWFNNRDPDQDDDGVLDFTVPDVADPGQVYYNRFTMADYVPSTGGGVYLRGGQVAVVGPRLITNFGSLDSHATSGPTHDPNHAPVVPYSEYQSQARIELQPDSVTHFNLAGDRVTPTVDSHTAPVNNATIGPVLGVVAAAQAPISWTGDPDSTPIGVNISEPNPWSDSVINPDDPATPAPVPGAAQAPFDTEFAAGRNYYRMPTRQLDSRAAQGFPTDSWREYDTATGELPDTPFDSRPYAELDRAFGVAGQQTGTRTHFRTAYLQRLADPTQPWHVDDNPYITVDYIGLDLTVFNGSDTNELLTAGMAMEWRDPADQDPFNSPPTERFATRYKTGTTWAGDPTAAGDLANQLYSYSTFLPEEHATTSAGGGNLPFFNRILHVNAAFDPEINGVGAPDQPVTSLHRVAHSSSLGFLNVSFGDRWKQRATADGTVTRFIGMPYENANGGYFANVLWLNRDFVSPSEIAWVPISAPGRFCAEFGIASTASGLGTAPTDNPFDVAHNVTHNPAGRYDFNQQFPHLFNFLSSNENVFAAVAGGDDPSPNFWRVLDWIEVPPPFDSDVDFLSPDSDPVQTGEQSIYPGLLNYAGFGPAGTVNGNPETWVNATASSFWLDVLGLEMLRAPFNMRSPDTRSGLVNLHTLKSKRIYDAIMYGFSTPAERTSDGAFWDDFLTSRRGYDPPTADASGPNLLQIGIDPPPANSAATALPPTAVNVGLNSLHRYFPTEQLGAFKPHQAADIAPEYQPPSGAATPTPPSPMMRRAPITSTMMRQSPAAGGDRMLFRRDKTAAPISMSQAQSHERSVIHQQLGASRLQNLTTGRSNVFAVWLTVGLFEVDPSTLTVGQELGNDLGRVERYRAFYIIDRGVPVMFRPGERNNVEGVIQVRRSLN